jgi:hypothetical protein
MHFNFVLDRIDTSLLMEFPERHFGGSGPGMSMFWTYLMRIIFFVALNPGAVN